jgi:hypothetical protein
MLSNHTMPASAREFSPGKMPVSAAAYAMSVSPVNYINAYYATRDVLSYQPKYVGIVGVGTGLETIILRNKYAIAVTTFDIDEGFRPDLVCSVHDMGAVKSKCFDVLLVSHVLEHLPYRFFRSALSEVARVSRHAVIYLPYGGRHPRFSLQGLTRFVDFRLSTTIPPTRRISGEKPELCAGQHFWEVGYRGFSREAIAAKLQEFFTIDKCYHNEDWTYSLNYCLTSIR